MLIPLFQKMSVIAVATLDMDTVLATNIFKATVFLRSSTQLNHILESYGMHNLNIYFEEFHHHYSCRQPKSTYFIVAKLLMEIFQFCGIIFSCEKGINCTFSGIFS